MATMKLVDGLELTTTKKEERVCSGCAKRKMRRLPFQTSVSPKMDRIGGRIHSDVCGHLMHHWEEPGMAPMAISNGHSKWTLDMGIHHETRVTYIPEQNGTSERVNPTVMESARGMMHSSGAPSWIWTSAPTRLYPIPDAAFL
jgi:hypothetical protein